MHRQTAASIACVEAVIRASAGAVITLGMVREFCRASCSVVCCDCFGLRTVQAWRLPMACSVNHTCGYSGGTVLSFRARPAPAYSDAAQVQNRVMMFAICAMPDLCIDELDFSTRSKKMIRKIPVRCRNYASIWASIRTMPGLCIDICSSSLCYQIHPVRCRNYASTRVAKQIHPCDAGTASTRCAGVMHQYYPCDAGALHRRSQRGTTLVRTMPELCID